jgi:hypothetical protein
MSASHGRNSPAVQIEDGAPAQAIIGTELLPQLNSSFSESFPSRNSSQKSVGSDSTALLYRYGQEIGSSSIKSSFSAGTLGTGLSMSMNQLPARMINSSGGIMYPSGMNPQNYEQFLLHQAHLQQQQPMNTVNAGQSLARSSFSSSIADDEHSLLSQVTAGNTTQLRNKPLKVVSGSQFRLTTKGTGPCPHCEVLEKTNKKNRTDSHFEIANNSFGRKFQRFEIFENQ